MYCSGIQGDFLPGSAMLKIGACVYVRVCVCVCVSVSVVEG